MANYTKLVGYSLIDQTSHGYHAINDNYISKLIGLVNCNYNFMTINVLVLTNRKFDCLVLLLSSDQTDTDAKLMKCFEYIQQEKEMLQKDVDQLDQILSKFFLQDVAVSSL